MGKTPTLSTATGVFMYCCWFVYRPPQADKILGSHPTAGVIVIGDFNQFDFRRLCTSTRENATLDLIFTHRIVTTAFKY